MLQSWKEVLPGDHYAVRTTGVLHSFAHKVVTSLYQPLVGIEAVSLYFTLWQEIGEADRGFLSTHHHLMSMMNLSLDRILKARKKLEAVSLLCTWKKKQEQPSFFLYQLVPPMTPDQFFHDPLLGVFLFHQVGSRDFQRLSRSFQVTKVQTGDYDDISASFDDVFESIPSDERSEEKQETADSPGWAGADSAGALRLKKGFDFKTLRAYLSDAILDEEALNDEVREAVEKLAFVYRTDPFDMSRAIETASLHTGSVDIEQLRKEVRDIYRLEHGFGVKPALYERTQPSGQSEMNGRQPQNEEERLIAWYETNSPYQLLEQLGHGSRPAAADLRLIENLMLDTKLNPGVINVLIDYVAKVNDYNLNKFYVEKIAAQWARANVRTVRQAMTVAREEKRKREQSRQQTAKKKPGRQRTSGSANHHEVIPEWMKENKPSSGSGVSDEEARKRAKWLEDYLNSI